MNGISGSYSTPARTMDCDRLEVSKWKCNHLEHVDHCITGPPSGSSGDKYHFHFFYAIDHLANFYHLFAVTAPASAGMDPTPSVTRLQLSASRPCCRTSCRRGGDPCSSVCFEQLHHSSHLNFAWRKFTIMHM